MSQTTKYKKGKYAFEILTKSGNAKLFSEGKLGWDKVLSADAIFVNAKKGNIAKSSDLKACFGTDNVDECAKKILQEAFQKGDLQVSAAERKEETEVHRRKVAAYLHKNYTDAAGLPHPLARIENIMSELKLNLNPKGNVQTQAEEIIKKMQGKVVFRINTVQYCLLVKKSYKNVDSIIGKYAVKYTRKNDKSDHLYTLFVSPSIIDDLIQELNKITEGDYSLEKRD